MATGISAISDFETTTQVDGSELILISKKDGSQYASKNAAISSLPFINEFNYASDGKAGVVKVGNRLTIDEDGVLNVNIKKINLDQYLPLSGGTMDGEIKSNVEVALAKADSDSYLEIDGGSSSATGAQLALAGDNCNIDDTGKSPGSFELISKKNDKESKLIGLPSGQLQWNSKNILRTINGVQADADGNAVIPNTSEIQDGLMSSADFIKLANIEEEANNYVLPAAISDELGGIKVGFAETEDSELNRPAIKLDTSNNAYADVDMNSFVSLSAFEEKINELQTIIDINLKKDINASMNNYIDADPSLYYSYFYYPILEHYKDDKAKEHEYELTFSQELTADITLNYSFVNYAVDNAARIDVIVKNANNDKGSVYDIIKQTSSTVATTEMQKYKLKLKCYPSTKICFKFHAQDDKAFSSFYKACEIFVAYSSTNEIKEWETEIHSIKPYCFMSEFFKATGNGKLLVNGYMQHFSPSRNTNWEIYTAANTIKNVYNSNDGKLHAIKQLPKRDFAMNGFEDDTFKVLNSNAIVDRCCVSIMPFSHYAKNTKEKAIEYGKKVALIYDSEYPIESYYSSYATADTQEKYRTMYDNYDLFTDEFATEKYQNSELFNCTTTDAYLVKYDNNSILGYSFVIDESGQPVKATVGNKANVFVTFPTIDIVEGESYAVMYTIAATATSKHNIINFNYLYDKEPELDPEQEPENPEIDPETDPET